MDSAQRPDHDPALLRLPSPRAVMTASFGDKKGAAVVCGLMHCGSDPTMLCVGLRKGHQLATLIRDSRCFAVCVLDERSRVLLRRFERPDLVHADPFDAVPTRVVKTGSPILSSASCAFDCEVVRHFDLEHEVELYVGQVLASVVCERASLRQRADGSETQQRVKLVADALAEAPF